MLSADIGLVAEKDLHHIASRPTLGSAVLRLNELAHDRDLESPRQIGLEHERILKHGQHLDGQAPVIIRDLPRQLFDSLLDLLGRNHLPQWLDSRFAHQTCRLRTLYLPNSKSILFLATVVPRSRRIGGPSCRSIFCEPETPEPTQSRRRSQRPAKARVGAAPHDAPGAIL